eukprot:m.358573 g.358573  ORF g.358573 m.358573 type:complete len:557 (+) comp18189_c0_seq1:35-1705(+)
MAAVTVGGKGKATAGVEAPKGGPGVCSADVVGVTLYSPNVCVVCFQPEAGDVKLRHCAQCKTATYCCVEHQKIHWSMHKRFCKLMTPMLDILFHPSLPRPVTFWAWWCERQASVMRLQALASHKGISCNSVALLKHKDMVRYAKHCAVCFNTDRDEQHSCPKCHMVNYCCQEHREQDRPRHTKQCRRYSLMLRAARCRVAHSSTPLWIPPTVLGAYQPLPFSWKSYFSLRGLLDVSEFDHAFAADQLCDPLTLLFALERLYFQREEGIVTLNQLSSLCLHVVAQDTRPVQALNKYEELFHFLPNLKWLKLLYITPSPDAESKLLSGAEFLCDHCLHTRNAATTCLTIFPGSYQDFCASCQGDYASFGVPDALFLFNIGCNFTSNLDVAWLGDVATLGHTLHAVVDGSQDTQRRDGDVDTDGDQAQSKNKPVGVEHHFALGMDERSNAVLSHIEVCGETIQQALDLILPIGIPVICTASYKLSALLAMAHVYGMSHSSQRPGTIVRELIPLQRNPYSALIHAPVQQPQLTEGEELQAPHKFLFAVHAPSAQPSPSSS